MFIKLKKDESGVTSIEYTLICSLIGILCLFSMQFAAGEIKETFNYIDQTLDIHAEEEIDNYEDYNNSDSDYDSYSESYQSDYYEY